MASRLLVVDDEPNLLRAVAAALRVQGYEVVTALTAAAALDRLSENLPDLVISDIRMPGMDGYALLRHLRARPETELLPVIFLTAKVGAADRIEGFRTGVDVYLTKPFELDELLAVIRRLLDRLSRTRAEIARAGVIRAGRDVPLRDEILTTAEAQVALAVARGLSNKEIASEFGISVRTVENHVSHILAKKQFGNRVEIARYVLEREGAPRPS